MQKGFFRGRPFLWWWLAVLPAGIASLWWEHGISYDDNGLGSLSFAILMTIGFPYLLGMVAIGALIPASIELPQMLEIALSLLGGSLPFFIGDILAQRWKRNRQARAGQEQ